MKKNKEFDCVEMKNSIQAQLLKEWEGMSDEEIEAQIDQKLRTSTSPVAKLWRSIVKRQTSSDVSVAMSH